MKKIQLLLLIISFSKILYCQEIRLFFGLGPGFPTSKMYTWLQSSRLGSNMGAEVEFKNFLLKIAFNPETSSEKRYGVGTTTRPILIEGKIWPADIQVNYMAIQYSIGYEVNLKNVLLQSFLGVSQNWLSTPIIYEHGRSISSEPNPNIVLETSSCLGPMFSARIGYNISTALNFKLAPIIYADVGAIWPRFEKVFTEEIGGLGYFFKIGICVAINKKTFARRYKYRRCFWSDAQAKYDYLIFR